MSEADRAALLAGWRSGTLPADDRLAHTLLKLMRVSRKRSPGWVALVFPACGLLVAGEPAVLERSVSAFLWGLPVVAAYCLLGIVMWLREKRSRPLREQALARGLLPDWRWVPPVAGPFDSRPWAPPQRG
jgi:hypothetical protein